MQLELDVAEAFPDSDTVNDALRLLMQAVQLTARKRHELARRG